MSDVEFTFGGNASSLKQALEEIKNELKQTREVVGSLTSRFADVYFSVQGAVAAIKSVYTALSTIPEQAARLEDLTTVFSQLQGDAAQAKDLLNALWQDAANGAIPLEELAATAKPLATVFGENNSIRDWTNRLADIASGSGMASEALGKLYARVMTLGRADSRAVDGLAKQGIPIYKALSEVMGASIEAVQEMAKKTGISADDYSAALRKMTDEGGEYCRMSAQLSNTAAGSWGTLVENMNRAAASFGQPINEAFTPILQAIAAYVEQILPDIQAFAESFVQGFSSAAEALSPVVSGIVSVVSALGGLKTLLASTAAALLIYMANTNQAAGSTISFKAQLASLASTMKNISASAVFDFKGMLSMMKSAMTSTLAGMRVAWSAAWSFMATAARAAMLAVKTALVSTGIGLIIVGIGEALGALYNWFMSDSEAAKEATEAAKQFNAELRQMNTQAEKVTTWEQYDSFISGLKEKIEELREARRAAYAEEDWAKGEQLTEQLRILWEKKKIYEETLPKQVEEARQAALAAELLRQQREEAEALAKKLEEARDKMADLVNKQRETEREKYLQGLDYDTQISLRLSDAGGFKTIEDLRAAMKALEEAGRFSLGDEEQYQKLATVYNTIVELKKRAAEATQKEAEAAKKLQEEEAKRKAETDAAQTNYNLAIQMLQAQIQGDQKRLDALKEQQRITQLTAEYQRQGLANAEECAKRMVSMERQAESMKELWQQVEQSRSRASAQRYSSSTAAYGGGGQSVLIGGPMVTEAKKQTKLLEKVSSAVEKTPTVKVSGNVEAVISR